MVGIDVFSKGRMGTMCSTKGAGRIAKRSAFCLVRR